MSHSQHPHRILHLSTFDQNGGAARAAHRLHGAQIRSGMHSEMWVMVKQSNDATVFEVGDLPMSTRLALAHERLREIRYLRETGTKGYSSLGAASAQIVDRINAHPADLVHLHWTNGMLSIGDIPKITKPLVWTLSDMWACSGCRHHPDRNGWRVDYSAEVNGAEGWDSRTDLDTWEEKLRCWILPFQLVAVSSWLAKQVHSSRLMSHWPLEVIHNVLDMSEWVVTDPGTARTMLGLDPDRPTVGFGSFGGLHDPVKGFDLLRQAILKISSAFDNLQLIIFGNEVAADIRIDGVQIFELGRFHSSHDLGVIYSAADVLAVPSRRETFGQVASEAHACGTPVVAFEETGLEDVVSHRQTGYLAKYLDVDALAEGLMWVLRESLNGGQHRFIRQCRKRAEQMWSEGVIVGAYARLYDQVMLRDHS